jgi:hypothetical protein
MSLSTSPPRRSLAVARTGCYEGLVIDVDALWAEIDRLST